MTSEMPSFDTLPPCDLLLLDLDGTLVNSSVNVERMWRAWCEKEDVDPAALLAVSEGRQGCSVVEEFAPHLDPVKEDAWIIDYQLQDVEGVEAIAGVKAALEGLGRSDWAIVTSCVRDLALGRLRATNLSIPPLLIPADEVPRSKPAPDGFLQAANVCGVDPSRCVVFEDSSAGVTAAREAGMAVVGVTCATRDTPAADVLVRDWTELTVTRNANPAADGIWSLRPSASPSVGAAPQQPR